MNFDIFKAPRFELEEDSFRARFINGFAWTGIALLAVGGIFYTLFPAGDFTVFILTALIAVLFGSLYLLRKRQVTAAGWIIVILGWLGIGVQAYTADGVKDVIIVAYIAIGLLASFIISRVAGTMVILSSIAVIAWLSVLEARGIFIARDQDPITFARDLSFVFVTIATLVHFSTTSLRDAIRRANRSESQLRDANRSLQELNQSLEERVASRTSDLQTANDRNERRARQFEAVSQVTRAITSNQGIESLLDLLVRVISDKFGFYHVGIFLVDDNREFAVLRAANSEGGNRMLARNHRLRIGQTGIVGIVTATGMPRIALDVGADAAFFDNPDLPDTRSEMALPLLLSGRVLGALDVQSVQANAFQPEDVEILATLADQVAVAIQNVQTFEINQRYLEEARQSANSYLNESWRALTPGAQTWGYAVTNNTLTPLDKARFTPMPAEASIRGKPIFANGRAASLAVPIRLASRAVGALRVQLADHEWDADEVDIINAVAERLSLALETATLLEATQKRADIERLTADITGKIGSSTQIDTILRTTAEELSRVFSGSDVLVQIQPNVLESDNVRSP